MKTIAPKCLFAVLIAAIILASAACYSGVGELNFVNRLEIAVDTVTIGALDGSDAGRSIRADGIAAGEERYFDFFGGGAYNIRVVDDDGVTYELYSVRLFDGDSIIISGSGDEAEFMILHSDDTFTTYRAYIFD